MYILTVCTLTHSRHIAIHFGGIGATTLMAWAGEAAGAGIVLTMAGVDIIPVIGAAAGMAADGDIIITTMVLAGAGAAEVAEAIGRIIIRIQIVVLHLVLPDIVLHLTDVHMVQACSHVAPVQVLV